MTSYPAPSESRKNDLDRGIAAGMLFPVMPVTYRIDLSRRLIHTRCIGDVTPEEIAEHFRELEQDPVRPDRLNVLLDLTEETSLPETQDLREVKYQLNKLLRSVRFGACAIVACDEALFGMMRMFRVLTAEYFDMTEVFRATVDAEAWLATVAT